MISLLPSNYLGQILEKGKKLPEGTVRDWKGKNYKKVSGKWIPQKKGGTKTRMQVGGEKGTLKWKKNYLSEMKKKGMEGSGHYKVIEEQIKKLEGSASKKQVGGEKEKANIQIGDEVVDAYGLRSEVLSINGNTVKTPLGSYRITSIHKPSSKADTGRRPSKDELDKLEKKTDAEIDKMLSRVPKDKKSQDVVKRQYGEYLKDIIKEVYNEIKDKAKNKGASIDDLAYEVNLALTKPIAQKKVKEVLKTMVGKSEESKSKFKGPKSVDTAYNNVYDKVVKDFEGDEGAEEDIEGAVQDRFKKKYGISYDEAMDEAVTNRDKKSKMKKSIPTMPGVKQIEQAQKPKKVVPQEVKAFIEKVESAFKVIDEAVSDLCIQKGVENCVELLASYTKFKSDFVYKLNDEINCPSGNDEEQPKRIDGEYSQSRVQVGKIKLNKK